MSFDVSQHGQAAPDPHSALPDLSEAAWIRREAALEEQMQQLAEAWLSSQDRMCESDERWRAEVRVGEEESRIWKLRADDLQAQLASQDEEVRALQELLFRKTSPDEGSYTETATLRKALAIESHAHACEEERCQTLDIEMREQGVRHQKREGQWLEERKLLLEQRVSDKEAMCQLQDEAKELRRRLETRIDNAFRVEKEKLLSEIQEQRSEMAQLRNQNEELQGDSLEALSSTNSQPMYLLNIDAMLSPRAAATPPRNRSGQHSGRALGVMNGPQGYLPRSAPNLTNQGPNVHVYQVRMHKGTCNATQWDVPKRKLQMQQRHNGFEWTCQ